MLICTCLAFKFAIFFQFTSKDHYILHAPNTCKTQRELLATTFLQIASLNLININVTQLSSLTKFSWDKPFLYKFCIQKLSHDNFSWLFSFVTDCQHTISFYAVFINNILISFDHPSLIHHISGHPFSFSKFWRLHLAWKAVLLGF